MVLASASQGSYWRASRLDGMLPGATNGKSGDLCHNTSLWTWDFAQ